jgi:hypothetical protein
MNLRSVLLEIKSALEAANIDYALIGGLALAAHGAARATVDLDLLADAGRSDDVDRLLRARGYECLHRNQNVANYASDDASRGRVDFLFASRDYGKEMLRRARPYPVLGQSIAVVAASDLIGLKVQSSSNDPSRLRRDMADIERLLQSEELDLDRIREYFGLFDRQKELDALLAERRSRR